MNIQSDIELKVCPFCGDTPRYDEGSENAGQGGRLPTAYIICDTCKLSLSEDTWNKTMSEAKQILIDRWNRRMIY